MMSESLLTYLKLCSAKFYNLCSGECYKGLLALVLLNFSESVVHESSSNQAKAASSKHGLL